MKIYTKRSCPYCHRVELALVERKISQDVVALEQIDFENLTESFLNINPNRKVPTIEFSPHDGFGESMLIVEYLDSIDAVGHKLFGNSAEEVGKTQFYISILDNKVTEFFRQITYTYGNKVDEKKLFARVPAVFAEFETLLSRSKGPFFGGDVLNAMDIQVIPFVLRYAAMPLIRPDWIMPQQDTRVGAYFQAVIHHDLVQKYLPGLDEVSIIVKRHTSLPAAVQKIKDSSRDLISDIASRLEKLNEQFQDARFSWRQEKNASGPFLVCSIRFINDEQALKAVSSIRGLQESSDHHSDFKLDNFATMTVEVCTHQPKWGVTEMDFVFAEALTQRMKGILDEK